MTAEIPTIVLGEAVFYFAVAASFLLGYLLGRVKRKE